MPKKTEGYINNIIHLSTIIFPIIRFVSKPENLD